MEENGKTRTTIYMDKELHRKVRIMCARQQTNLSKLIIEYLEEKVKESEQSAWKPDLEKPTQEVSS
jgi:hypothetical protein